MLNPKECVRRTQLDEENNIHALISQGRKKKSSIGS